MKKLSKGEPAPFSGVVLTKKEAQQFVEALKTQTDELKNILKGDSL